MMFFGKSKTDYSDICLKVANSAHKHENRKVATASKLTLTTVSWEDNARSKNSSLGPCISDMTLGVGDHRMPLIRGSSNFEDETWDVDMDKITLVVGNESGSPLRSITLREYLSNFRAYLHSPDACGGTQTSLLTDVKEQHVICSAQACMLPVSEDGEAKFNVRICNYQSSPRSSAVLVLIASASGTSAQVVTGAVDRLYHNNNGQRAAFIAERLSKHRSTESGSSPSKTSKKAPMTDAEKEKNILLVIQVPLKHTNGEWDPASSDGSECESSDDCDVEDAILKVGENEGPFAELAGCDIERDERFPIRVTVQFYKATSNGKVNKEVMDSIAAQLAHARQHAVAISSLVTETTNRTTEHNVH